MTLIFQKTCLLLKTLEEVNLPAAAIYSRLSHDHGLEVPISG